MNLNDLIYLLNYITSKLSLGFYIESLHYGTDKATDKLFSSFLSIGNNNGKAGASLVSAKTIHAKILLHVFGSGCTS